MGRRSITPAVVAAVVAVAVVAAMAVVDNDNSFEWWCLGGVLWRRQPSTVSTMDYS